MSFCKEQRNTEEDDPLTVLSRIKASLHVKFSDLPTEAREEIENVFRALKPLCPTCFSNDCKYRYLNNKHRSKVLQPRFACNKCDASFTLGGRRYLPQPHSREYKYASSSSSCRRSSGIQKAESMMNVCSSTSHGSTQISDDMGYSNFRGHLLRQQERMVSGCDNYSRGNGIGNPSLIPYSLENNISVPESTWPWMIIPNLHSSYELFSPEISCGYNFSVEAVTGCNNDGVQAYSTSEFESKMTSEMMSWVPTTPIDGNQQVSPSCYLTDNTEISGVDEETRKWMQMEQALDWLFEKTF